MTTYGVLGVGSIAAAIVTGLGSGPDAPAVLLSPRNAVRSAELAAALPTVHVATDNQQVVDDSDVVIVCLRHADAAAVLAGLRFRAEQAVVSAVAGLPLAALAAHVAPAAEVARSIPLPAVEHRESRTPVYPATAAASELFDRLGGSLPIADEPTFDAVAAASATVAAHAGYLRTIADWLVGRGLEPAAARRYVADTFAGLAGELAAPDVDFERLAAAHATPGGLNEQFARSLEAAGLPDAVRAGLDGVLSRIAEE